MMTVKDLIEQLKRFPEEMKIMTLEPQSDISCTDLRSMDSISAWFYDPVECSLHHEEDEAKLIADKGIDDKDLIIVCM